jgi:protein tyrosine kinase modulator
VCPRESATEDLSSSQSSCEREERMGSDNLNGRAGSFSDYSSARVNPRLASRYEEGGDPAIRSDRTATRTESTSSLEELLQVLRRRIWAIVLTVLVLVGATTGFGLIQTPTYEATITVLVGQESNDGTTDNLSGDVQGLQGLTATMADAVTTLPVAQAVVEQQDMSPGSAERLLDNLSAQANPTTMFIEVSYRDTNPQRAQQTVNTVGEVFSQQVSKVSPSASAITATVWEPAVLPETPVSPDLLRNAVMAVIGGLLLGVGLAFLLERFDNSWGSPEEVERISGVPTFGAIPRFEVLATVKEKGEK